MAEYLLRYTVGLTVEADENATDDELRQLYMDAFEEWLVHGGQPFRDDVQIEEL